MLICISLNENKCLPPEQVIYLFDLEKKKFTQWHADRSVFNVYVGLLSVFPLGMKTPELRRFSHQLNPVLTSTHMSAFSARG